VLIVMFVASQTEVPATHAPAAQRSPEAHAWPQAPQFAVSVCVVTQALPQSVQPGWQVAAQVEPLHRPTAFVTGEQLFVQLPQ
jgi:hypothetical protein